ncbi:methylase involved in ubiquinone/menaquinone biosynthesis [Methyloglobulus morosus KoM1]|uniref:Methylase involved in ubiquinone/menaquinone biosynthesis n=1 Tax=Methyloglobulus morosus KoM1 TaxID=1116472 RepID=V5C607_9GAMM|nr:class I SAM-dependent methyltransferase [Methyloglobulus morosus]ESS73897.1 methylase involved in ubiquinone/menaquinone biosynthesis [Methyloglobulus morosus KoM1]
MQRILELELMEDVDQVIAYAQADFEKPHNDFLQRLKTFVNEPTFNGKALDLGCGSGDISRRFASAFPFSKIDAVDGSKPMIDYALNSIDPVLQLRLNFIHGKLPDTVLPESSYDIIFSNSLLHHLPNPQVLWQLIKKCSAPGTRIVVMDLLRPVSKKMAKTLVEMYAIDEPKILQRDFYNSLLAAFSLEEIDKQLAFAELPLAIEQVSDRHVFLSGIAN